MNANRRTAFAWLAAIVLFVSPQTGALAQASATAKTMDTWARQVWTQREGLPNDQVNALSQTGDGYLWIATPDGLARFNGSEFVYHDRASVPELHDNDIRHLALGIDNSLLIGTARGGMSFLHQGYWTERAGKDGGLSEDSIVASQEDARGRLWVATAGAGIDRLDGRRKAHFDSRNGLPSDRVLSLLVAGDGSVWIGTAAGLARIVGDQVQTISVNAGLLPSGPVSALAESPDRALWVGTRAGAYRQRSGERQFEKMTPDASDDAVLAILPDSSSQAMIGTAQHGLLRVREGRSETIRAENPERAWQVDSLLRGQDGSLWVGGSQGLMRLRDTPFGAFGKSQGLVDENVHAVMQTADGEVWIGTASGLERIHDGRASRIDADSLSDHAVLALAPASDGGLWAGTDTGRIAHLSHGHVDRTLDAARGADNGRVRAIVEDADGGLWIATDKGLLRRDPNGATRVFTSADGLPNDSILALHRDGAGRLWIGTGNGLTYREADRFVHVAIPIESMVQTIYGFAGDADGTLWIASDRGLLRWKNAHVSVIASRQGLPVDTVYAVAPDPQDGLWLTTPSGLARVARAQANAVADGRTANLVADLYGEADGLPASQFSGGATPSLSLLSDGSLWAATASGIAQVHPARVADYRSEPPQTLIEEIRVNDRVVVANGALDLGPETRKLDVRFFALNYHLPKRIEYRYLLEGYDADWSEVGEHTSVQFTNLPPRDYRLRIQSAVSGGPWSPREAVLTFKIDAYLWQIWWFDALMIVVLTVGAGLTYAARIRVIAENQRRLQLLVNARTNDLRQQTDRLREADAEKSRLLELVQSQSEAFERQAREDALTGLANRRRVDESLDAYFSESRRSGRPLSLVLMDIDFFKRINDRFSHAIGDEVLREIGAILTQDQRPGDLAARLGGEEFLGILSGSDLDGARVYGERMRTAIESHDWERIAAGLRVTISIGVATWDGEESYSRLFTRTDELLYRAKEAGRNRVES